MLEAISGSRISGREAFGVDVDESWIVVVAESITGFSTDAFSGVFSFD